MAPVAQLRFSFGTMGSGKSTVALQIHHNLASRGLKGLLLTRLDRDGTQVTSRLGVAAPAVEVGDDVDLFALATARGPLDYLVCDEAQFYAPAQCDQLARVVDEMGADVYAFGLITDFRGLLFDGTKRLLEIADERVPLQVEARCWCGREGHAQRPAGERSRRLRGRRRRGGRHGRARRPALRRHRALRAPVPPSLRQRRAGGRGAGGRRPLSYFQAQGMRLMPLMKLLCRYAGSPVTRSSGRRRRISSNITVISRRARLAPRQKWGPPAP